MPIRGSPHGARHSRPQVVAIARNGVVAINWNRWSRSSGARRTMRVQVRRAAH
jgi:hypothetical protein